MANVLFESPGEWWLPADEQRRVPGVLRIDANGRLTIQLFDTLDRESSDFGAPVRREILHGSVHESPLPGGTELTHFDSFAIRRSLRSNGTNAETLVANRSYVGDAHVRTAEQGFSKYSARLRGLAAWLPLSAVDRKASGGTVRIEVNKPVKFSVDVAGTRMDFVKAAEVSFSDEETTIRESAKVFFETKDDRPRDDFVRELLFPLRSLLSLALGEPTRAENLDVNLGDDGPWPVEVHDLEVWAQAAAATSTADARTFDFLIARPKTERELEALLGVWWDVQGRMRTAIARIFALWEAPPTFIEVRFGAVSDALELLARSLPSSPEPEAMLASLGAPAIEALPPVEHLTARWRAAREGLRAGQSPDTEELLRLCDALSWLMRFVLLEQVGVPLELAGRARAFRHAASRFEST